MTSNDSFGTHMKRALASLFRQSGDARPPMPGALQDTAQTAPPPVPPLPSAPSPTDNVPPPSAADIDRQLKDFRDVRIQRWILYVFLMGFSAAFLWLFLHIVCTAWDQKTQAVMIEFAKLGPSATTLLGALVVAIVAIPLSLCLTLAKMVSAPKQSGTPDDSQKFTSALFELGKAFAQGFKSLRGE